MRLRASARLSACAGHGDVRNGLWRGSLREEPIARALDVKRPWFGQAHHADQARNDLPTPPGEREPVADDDPPRPRAARDKRTMILADGGAAIETGSSEIHNFGEASGGC